MDSFRCYALDSNGRIIVAENVEAIDTDDAINRGKQFVTMRQTAASPDPLHQHDAGWGLEVWQGTNLVFTTLKRPGQRASS